eukprot:5062916-Prymnesium_polylepis.1
MARGKRSNRSGKKKGKEGGKAAPKEEAGGAEDEEEETMHFMAMTFADLLKDDILQLSCLTCNESGGSAAAQLVDGHEYPQWLCSCAATLHPFCGVFHNWVRLRLTGACSTT